MPDFRRGAQAVADAQARAKASSGDFIPFTPSIWWTDPAKDDENSSRYIMFLNEMNDIPQVDYIGYIPQVKKKSNGDKFTTFESVIARTDVALGESEDPMVDKWGADPRETHIAVAVELEPTFETIKGRQRPTGFEVKTSTFTRRVRDDEGELTDEEEEVTAPSVGFVAQSPHNFFNLVTSFDNDTAPIEETALRVKRLDKNTYDIEGYPDQEIDLSALLDHIDGLSYLGNEVDDLIEAVDLADSDQEAALVIGSFLLDKRLDELADRDRYDKLFEGITEPFRYGTKTSSKSDAKPKKERPARRSQRRSAETEAATPGDEPGAEAPVPDEPVEEKPKRARTRKPAAKKVESKQENPATLSKLDELRQRQEKRKAAATA